GTRAVSIKFRGADPHPEEVGWWQWATLAYWEWGRESDDAGQGQRTGDTRGPRGGCQVHHGRGGVLLVVLPRSLAPGPGGLAELARRLRRRQAAAGLPVQDPRRRPPLRGRGAAGPAPEGLRPPGGRRGRPQRRAAAAAAGGHPAPAAQRRQRGRQPADPGPRRARRLQRRLGLRGRG
ncbi:unnamed protein product, partial [Prorocentrum cordatum]